MDTARDAGRRPARARSEPDADEVGRHERPRPCPGPPRRMPRYRSRLLICAWSPLARARRAPVRPRRAGPHRRTPPRPPRSRRRPTRRGPRNHPRTAGPYRRNADALIEAMTRNLDDGDLPTRGGQRPHLVLTMGLNDLIDSLGSALLDTGGRAIRHRSPPPGLRLRCRAHGRGRLNTTGRRTPATPGHHRTP